MEYKSNSNITYASPNEGATENIREGLNYEEMYSM